MANARAHMRAHTHTRSGVSVDSPVLKGSVSLGHGAPQQSGRHPGVPRHANAAAHADWKPDFVNTVKFQPHGASPADLLLSPVGSGRCRSVQGVPPGFPYSFPHPRL